MSNLRHTLNYVEVGSKYTNSICYTNIKFCKKEGVHGYI